MISTYWSRLFLNNFQGRYVSGKNILICLKIHSFPSGGSVVTWFNWNSKFLNQHGDHQEILYVFFEPLPIFYEPLCSVCLAGWHKARDPGLPKDFLLGFVLALCCCSQENKILSEGALFFTRFSEGIVMKIYKNWRQIS